jgi:glucose-6-phosphate 1-epimerase
VTIEAGEFQGFPVLRIETPLATAAISLHGGQLLSYAPRGFDDLLWLSPVSKRAPDAIRGGVPVCWPYFGREGQSPEVPQHGFARNTQWTLVDSRIDAEGEATIELALPQKAGVPLRLTQILRIGNELHQSLATHNIGVAAVSLTQALHTYFRVGDAERTHVTGLEGSIYADRYDGQRHTQSGEWNLQDPRDPGRSDRTYQRTSNRFALVDPALNRRIDLTTSGSRSLVVWNPGQTGIAAIGDAPSDGWRHFVCLEAANAGEDVIELEPNGSHSLQQIVSVSTL